MNYRSAGVDIDLKEKFLAWAAKAVRSTHDKNVSRSIGDYAALYSMGNGSLIASCADGVGTKLKLAFDLNIHDTVGIDLVAMNVNDLICVGARPMFFLDYIASSQLPRSTLKAILSGMVEGCKQAGCALIGGETAQMPDFYAQGEYDLAGFAVGQVNKKALLPKKNIEAGDVLLGLRSSGFHSNGFSLLRKLLPGGKNGRKLSKELLTPTRIYVKSVSSILDRGLAKGLAHITGSGFLNVPRISSHFSYEIVLPSQFDIAEIIPEMLERSELSLEEQARTFNLGIGMIIVVSAADAGDVVRELRGLGETAWIVGSVLPRRGQTQVRVYRGTRSATLFY